MPFVKVSRSVKSFAKRPARRKAAVKEDWVDTVNDLTVHRATALELARRSEIHRSHNQAVAQCELRERAVKHRQRKHTAHRDSLLDAVSQSERALAVVKDLFGDIPHRLAGFPSVTTAPACADTTELCATISQDEGEPEESSELEMSEGNTSSHLHQRLLNGNVTPKCHTRAVRALNATDAVQRVRPKNLSSDDTSGLVSLVLNPNPGRKTKCFVNSSGSIADVSSVPSPAHTVQGRNQLSVEQLQCMMGAVEEELDAVNSAEEPHTPVTEDTTSSLTSFSLSLVSNLTRMARQLRQISEQLQVEQESRGRLQEHAEQQQQLITVLSAQLQHMQEDNAALQQRVEDLELRLDTLVLALGEDECDRDAPDAESDRGTDVRECVFLPAVMLSPPCQKDRSGDMSSVLTLHHSQYADEAQLPVRCSSAPLLTTPPQQPQDSTHRDTSQHAVLQQECVAQATSESHTGRTNTQDETACPMSDVPSVCELQQRLAELSEQSAAARSKLLQLIDQQRHTARETAGMQPV